MTLEHEAKDSKASNPTVPSGTLAVGAAHTPPVEAGRPASEAWLRKNLNILALVAITVLNGIGWLVLYYLVLVPQVEQNIAQTRLLDAQSARLEGATQKLADALDLREKAGRIEVDDANLRLLEAQIRKLESTAMRLEEQVSSLRQRTQASTDLNTLMQGLRPNVAFGRFDFAFPSSDLCSLEHEIKNIGVNAAIVDEPRLFLATQPFGDTVPKEGVLVLGQDYSFELGQRTGMVLPGQALSAVYRIRLLRPELRGRPLYYRFLWTVTTDPTAVANAATLLGKHANQNDLRSRSVFSSGLGGHVTF